MDQALENCLPGAGEYPKHLHQAMRYAVFSGGKRVRPILVLAAAEAVGSKAQKVMPAACAIELIHSYSLVHDDLPSMDNDTQRRGKPTCHIKFGEDTAILAGDALLTLAFKILSEGSFQAPSQELKRRLEALGLIAQAAGNYGMVGGQVLDMEFQKKHQNASVSDKDLPAMEFINVHKTGALIAVSTRVGALLGGGTKAQTEALYRYGKRIGHLFQIVDDIMDKEGYAKILGAQQSWKQAEALVLKAKQELKIFEKKAATLEALADFILMRKN